MPRAAYPGAGSECGELAEILRAMKEAREDFSEKKERLRKQCEHARSARRKFVRRWSRVSPREGANGDRKGIEREGPGVAIQGDAGGGHNEVQAPS
eukprot:IDg10274t1